MVAGAAVGALVLGAGFVRHGMRSTRPMLDPRVFTIARLRSGAVGIAAVFFGLFALFFVNAQYLQYAKGYSALTTGIAILPLPIGMAVVSRRSIAFAQRLGARTVVVGGLAALASGLAALSFIDAATPYIPYAGALPLVAAGMVSACRPHPPASSAPCPPPKPASAPASTVPSAKSARPLAWRPSVRHSPAGSHTSSPSRSKAKAPSSRPCGPLEHSGQRPTTKRSPPSPTRWRSAFEPSPS